MHNNKYKTTEERTSLKYCLFSNQKNATLALQLEDAPCCKISISITFFPCPNGFAHDKSAMKCVCDERLKPYITDYKIVSLHANYIERKSNAFWMAAFMTMKPTKGLSYIQVVLLTIVWIHQQI